MREWHTVTVAFACISSIAIGRPTISLRPITTASLPGGSMSYARSSSMQPGRRRRHVDRRAEIEIAGVERVEAVDVLRRRDGVRHPRLVHVRRQRELHEDPVDLVVVVQPVDEREHVVLARVGREAHVAGVDPGLGRRLVLRGDVDVRGRVVADEHRREADVAELRDLARDVGAHLRGELLPVHAHGGHRGDSRRRCADSRCTPAEGRSTARPPRADMA